MSLDQYKCEICKNIEDFVFTCSNNHLTCEKCAKQVEHMCKCKALLMNRSENPICKNIKEKCPYIEEGCKLSYGSEEMKQHVEECKFRAYRCVGSTLGAWICDWDGIQMDLENHFRVDHPNLGDFFTYFQDSSVLFNDENTYSSINLINAFSRRFVFYYQSNLHTKMVIFMIYLLGRKEDAQHYFTEFKIKSPKAKIAKIKFFNEVYSDSEDIPKLIAQERCVALTHRTIENHLDEDRIHFRFVIKRKDEKAATMAAKGSAKIITTAKSAGPVKKLENPFVFKNKGQIKPNNTRKPTCFQGGGGGGGLNISAEESKADDPCPTPDIDHSLEFSSINRDSETNGNIPSPCYSASILKDNCFDLKSSARSRYGRYYSTPCADILPLQPYKACDERLYRNQYPGSCLSKPLMRR